MEKANIIDQVLICLATGAAGIFVINEIVRESLGYLNVLTSRGDPQISTQAELEQIVREEADKLKMKLPDFIFFNTGESFDIYSRGTYARKYPGGQTVISIELGRGRKAVKHELYHLYKGDCDYHGIFHGLKSTFINEPRAILYGNFNIKL